MCRDQAGEGAFLMFLSERIVVKRQHFGDLVSSQSLATLDLINQRRKESE